MVTCARCDGAAVAVAADLGDQSADLCTQCAAGWIAYVAADAEASLRVFTGAATDDELAADKHRRQAERAAEKARDREQREKQQRDRENRETAQREAAEVREDRARQAARLVAKRGPMKRGELAAALGLSARTLSRVVQVAVDREWVVSKPGGKGGIFPGRVSVPSDPNRAEVEAADEQYLALTN